MCACLGFDERKSVNLLLGFQNSHGLTLSPELFGIFFSSSTIQFVPTAAYFQIYIGNNSLRRSFLWSMGFKGYSYHTIIMPAMGKNATLLFCYNVHRIFNSCGSYPALFILENLFVPTIYLNESLHKNNTHKYLGKYCCFKVN